MSEPIIHVIPEQYYGGGAKTKMVKPAAGVSAVSAPTAPRKLSRTTLFIIIVGVLFLITLGGAGWYFTRGLRAPTPTPAPSPPVAPPAPEAPAPETPSPALLAPEAPPTPAEPETPSLAPAQPEPVADTDRDGLTETEERMYRSDPVRPDTDNDGFLDGHEVVNLYNPTGIAPEKLEAAGLAKKYDNESGGYSVLIPTAWQASPSPEDSKVAFINNENGARIFEMHIIDNSNGSLQDWYERQHLAVSGASKPWTANKSGIPGLTSADENKGYFAAQARIYEIMFAEGQNPAEYKTTFGMILNSFRVRP